MQVLAGTCKRFFHGLFFVESGRARLKPDPLTPDDAISLTGSPAVYFDAFFASER